MKDHAQADRQRLIRDTFSNEAKLKEALKFLGQKYVLARGSSFDPRHPPVLQKS